MLIKTEASPAGALREPFWQPYRGRRFPLAPLPSHRWLKDEGSLTRRVICACPGQFSVRVLRQGLARPLESERQLLGMQRGEQALLREVQLQCDQAPWVFARTLIPGSSLVGRARRLAFLGSKPLGAVLFADPATHRGALEMACLRPGDMLFHKALQDTDCDAAELWGRRTVFFYAGKPLLVNEIFLPDIARPCDD